MNYDQLRLKIQNSIKGNASREITGFLLQEVLLSMVDILGTDIIAIGSTSKVTDSDKLGGYPASHYATAVSVTSLENLLASMWSIDEAGNLVAAKDVIIPNLTVRGDTASGAKGTEGGVVGGLLGIKVNGKTYDAPVNGILTIPDYPTSLAWSAIEGKPTKLSQFTNDAGFITSAALSGYAKKTDIPTSLPASDVYEWAKAATKPSYTKADVGLGNVENKSSATIRGEITATNVTNALGYTPANNASLANYLPLSGGALTNKSYSTVLALSGASSSLIEFQQNGTKLGAIGYNSNGAPVAMNGTSYVNLIHSGNIGSQSVAAANEAMRFKDVASSGDLNTVLAGGGMARTYSNYLSTDFTNAPSNSRYGAVLQLSTYAFVGLESLSAQLAWDVNHASTTDTTRYLWWRVADSSNVFKYAKWHQIAFTDSNVAWSQGLKHSNGTIGAVVNSSGNVGIGTESPQAKLHVAGNAIITGDTATGSDIRFKDKITDHRIAISDIAEAPLFTFKWNDREDKTVHLGSSAQYWEKVAPWLVKGEDFKTLDYSTLGVAIGISLANKTINLEDRVKVLEKENKALKEQIRRIQYGS